MHAVGIATGVPPGETVGEGGSLQGVAMGSGGGDYMRGEVPGQRGLPWPWPWPGKQTSHHVLARGL
jgi:hypothetical protein